MLYAICFFVAYYVGGVAVPPPSLNQQANTGSMLLHGIFKVAAVYATVLLLMTRITLTICCTRSIFIFSLIRMRAKIGTCIQSVY